MADESSNQESGEKRSSRGGGEGSLVWFLVDRADGRVGIDAVADMLESEGIETEVVTISEVIGSAAREAVAGGAERILRGLRIAWQGKPGEEDFLQAIRRARPDLLVVTSPRHARPLSLLESLTGTATIQVGLPTNYNVERAWLNGSIDAFIVPDATSREDLAESGYDDDRLFVAGPPISPNFEEEIDREAVRKELGFGEESVALVRADSFDATVLDRLIFQATLVEDDVRFIFHHNGDGAVAQALRRSADKHGLPAAMFGRVADLERYVHAADAVIASPLDPLIPEVVAAGRPLFLVGPAEGYRTQVDTITGDYGADYLKDVLRFGSEFEEFLGDESTEEIENRIAESKLSPGNRGVVDALGESLERVDDWRTEREPRTKPEPEVEPKGGKPAPTGPFETIGTGESRGRPSAEPKEAEPGGAADVRRRTVRPGISRAEAKDQLAELILIERDLERRLSELEREQERWRNRLDLAREWGEDDLADEAKGILRDYIDDAAGVQDELEDVRRQKAKLKSAAKRGEGGPSPRSEGPADIVDDPERAAELEKRFSEMEIDKDLDDLRDRIEGELGD